MGKKSTQLFDNLLKTTKQFITGKGYKPLTKKELMARLQLPLQHETVFKKVLNTLLRQGQIEFANDRYVYHNSQNEIASGTLSVHPRGFGFVEPDDRSLYPQDIFIPKPMMQNAIHGDKVEVQINTGFVSEKGPEGKIVAVVSRSRTHLAGIIKTVNRHEYLFAYVPLLGATHNVVVQPNPNLPVQTGDRVIMEVLEWGSKETETVCRVSHLIGPIADPSCDNKAVIEEFEIRDNFPHAAIEEARAFGQQVSRRDCAGREDLRDLETFTIDPDTAKDFDDALSLSQDKDGHYHLAVHIADVSHYVRSRSHLDQEARLRCNSTYLPGQVVPMLPHELSSNLCSLKPDVNRLAVTAFMHFNSDGTLIEHRIARSVIKSAKRFTYKEAKKVLDGQKRSKHLPTLRLMVDLCLLLKKKRYERGSLEFCLPELVIKVDDQGEPTGTEIVQYDITHQLVEEFMLKTNEVIALHISEQGKDLAYRVHDEPAAENLKDFSNLARAFGFYLPESPSPSDLQRMFEEAVNSPYGQHLASCFIRRMRLATYSPDNIGHYGLSLTHYCHFTSPIRRYVDLVVHRILFGENEEFETLEEIAKQCSEQERVSAKAESNVVLLKKLRLLDKVHNQEPWKEYSAIITRIRPFGVYFEVLDFMLEGFIHISELGNDYFVYDEGNMRLQGADTGQTFTSADPITVMLASVDFILLESKWHLVTEKQVKKKVKKRKRS